MDRGGRGDFPERPVAPTVTAAAGRASGVHDGRPSAMDCPGAVGAGALPVITVITPTADRPAAWPLAERWMARQTVQPDQWIVADDGIAPAPLTMGQQHIR